MSIEKAYIRTSPDGIVSEIFITNQKFLEYHRNLEKNHGYKYTPKTVIHSSEATCISCEG